MGRGRTTTGMTTACLISSIVHLDGGEVPAVLHETSSEIYDSMDGPSEEEAYLQGTFVALLMQERLLNHV